MSHQSVTPLSLPSLAGLGSLFSAANLSGISNQPLRVSSVLHASAIELSEEGMEASATTAVMTTRSVSHFSVNSPFLFALVEESSMVPLFMGVVTNPAPDNDDRMSNDDPDGNSTMSDDPIAVPNQQDAELCSSKTELEEEDSSTSSTSSRNESSSNSNSSSSVLSSGTSAEEKQQLLLQPVGELKN